MIAISTVLAGVLYEAGHSQDEPGFLRNHPGNGAAIARDGWRVRHHPKVQRASAADAQEILDRIAALYDQAQEWCESPIERDMLAALMTANWDQCADPIIPVVKPSSGHVPDKPVVILPQFQVGRCRLDFAILCRGLKSPSIVAVECDGAEFHDRQRDAERDAYLKAFGVHVFRASGSVINRAPEDISNTIVNLVQDRI